MKLYRKVLLIFVLFLSVMLVACTRVETDQLTVEKAFNELELIFALGDDETKVSKQIGLLDTLHGTTITWASSNVESIDVEGNVFPGDTVMEVELYATIKLGSYQKIKMFIVTVVKGPEKDTIAPVLRIDADHLIVTLKQGETIDLYEGLTAFDNVDLDITDQIKIIDDGGVNFNLEGEYTVQFQVEDRAGNLSLIVSKIVRVLRVDTILSTYPIYSGIIQGEASKPGKPKEFAGAWYHKVVSSKDYWVGIEGVITLPKVQIRRYADAYNTSLDIDPNVKNLDNPSIYMGGNAYNESDVGLSLSLVKLGNGTVTKGSYAFRPFWRYITNTDYDLGGVDLAAGRRYGTSTASPANQVQKNIYGNWYFEDSEFYYLPGDKVRMLVYSPKPNYLQLQIEVLEVSTYPESVQIRQENGWKDPADFISPMFSSPGHGASNVKAEFKRVNAIDQSGNEGKPTINTNTKVSDAIWESVYLHRRIDGTLYRVPFNNSRLAVINYPLESGFIITEVDDETGGSTVTIDPKNG